MFTVDNMNIKAYMEPTLELLQHDVRKVIHRGGWNETTLPVVQIQNELFETQFGYAYMSILWARMAEDDIYSDGPNRKFLTSFKTGCNLAPMKPATNTRPSPFNPEAANSLAGFGASGSIFDLKPTEFTHYSGSRYLTHTHKVTPYMLSEVGSITCHGSKNNGTAPNLSDSPLAHTLTPSKNKASKIAVLLRCAHSLFLSALYTLVTKGLKANETAICCWKDRPAPQGMENQEQSIAAYKQEHHSNGLRIAGCQEATRPRLPHDPVNGFGQRNQRTAMALGSGEGWIAQRQQRPLAECLRPAAVVMGYWRQVLSIEEDATVFDVVYLESVGQIELREAA